MRKDGISVLIWCFGIWDAFIYRYTQIYHVALGYHVTNDMISLVDKYANDIARNHCNFTEALPWLRAGSFVMDTAADAQQFPWVISYILHVTITLKNRTDFRSLFFPSVNWWKVRSVLNFEAYFEANMLLLHGTQSYLHLQMPALPRPFWLSMSSRRF